MAEFNGVVESLILEPSSSTMKSSMQFIDDLIGLNFTDDIHASVFSPNVAPVLAQSPSPFFEDFRPENKKEKGSSGRKRKRDTGTKEMERASEVIHVRVKRGQATDSHSLAERLRRQKINERLKSLQNLVPGCYKTMGMAVMLDVIIQYIRSLQNQIEFLSMKLSAANSYCDLNSIMEINGGMETVVQDTNVSEGLVTDGYGGGLSYFNPTIPF